MPQRNDKSNYDFIDRKMDIVHGIFKSMSEQSKRNILGMVAVFFMLTTALFIGLWVRSKNTNKELMELRLIENNQLRDRIIRSLQPQIEQTVKREVKEETKPIAEGAEKALQGVNEIIENMKK